jgi:PAS domain S-box-containing protein
MMPALSLAEASSPIRAHSQNIDPGEWNAWIALAGSAGLVASWVWRHSLGAMWKWLWNFVRAPHLIQEQNLAIRALLDEIHRVSRRAEFAVIVSQVSWSFVERPVLQCDALGLCSFANDFSVRLLGCQQEELSGSGWLTLVHTEDAERVERLWRQCVADKRNFVHKFRLVDRNGQEAKVFDRAEILYDRDNNVLGWYHLMSVIND